ncbi:TonB-dependent receptor plug domain-containing protein [Pedobacter sp. MW01-1-1]|uniref:TonB-dependent receptor plug domain-containing protein n=1 Tax=Pedobacter sp. MW01-1-1 TaxID=3383027 RepID=UPI003FED7120
MKKLAFVLALAAFGATNGFSQEQTPVKKDGKIVVSGIDHGEKVLIVLDGKKQDVLGVKSIDDLDKNSIESIQVLKGEAAIKLYGMEAQNGVLLITTKTGVADTLKGKVQNGNAPQVEVLSGSIAAFKVDGLKSNGMSAVTIKDNAGAAKSSPVYYVDGIEVDKDALKFIAPDTIERVTVLKTPDSTKLYGEKGVNGVVLIVTKKIEDN